jgi:phenylacetate-coenzyme A ligase PaaK-like adenylate-forming protein
MTHQAEPLWLDIQATQRLTEAFPWSAALADCPQSPLASELQLHIRLWQLSRLAQTLRQAMTGSRHYRRQLNPDHIEASLRAASRQCDLPEQAPERAGNGNPLQPCALPPVNALESAIRHLLDALPFTFPRQLAEKPDAFLAVSHSTVEGVISLPTSGTTGAGKRVFCSADDLRETAAFFRHGMQYMVLPGRGDRVALLMSGDRPGSVGDLLLRGMEALGVECAVPGFVPPTPQGEDEMMRRLVHLAPTCLVAVPCQALALSRHALAPELARHTRCVLLSGDSVTPVMRRAIASGLHCEVFLHYGLTETGLGGAVECGEHAGCHTRDLDLLYEVVDEKGHALPPGQWGEITLTTLSRQAMPLLRYRTGDWGRLLPGYCACGSVLGRVHVRGRISERVPLPDGGFVPCTDLDEALYALPCVLGYAPALRDDHGQPHLAVSVRLAPEAPAEALTEAERALSAVPGLDMIAVSVHAQDGLADDPRRMQAKRHLRRET